MGDCYFSKTTAFLFFVLALSSGGTSYASLYQPPATSLTYHRGALLEGVIPVSILWYGRFTPAQKSIITDFLLSLSPNATSPTNAKQPSVARWWSLVQIYLKNAGKKPSVVKISTQAVDDKYSQGKVMSRAQIQQLAGKLHAKPGGLTLVLTSEDVAVERFCMSSCGFHDGDDKRRSVFVWVGNSASQCPGQCAWPFHQPMYGPQTPPLISPNGDVGVDGMIINIATLFAGAVTNPYGNGYFQGPEGAGLEVGSACAGVYGKGAYPGYPGEVMADSVSGGSYNAVGVNGRKYMLPAVWNPSSSQCSTLL